MELTKEKFIELYNTHTNIELEQLLGTTQAEIEKYRKKFGLSKPKGRRPNDKSKNLKISGLNPTKAELSSSWYKHIIAEIKDVRISEIGHEDDEDTILSLCEEGLQFEE